MKLNTFSVVIAIGSTLLLAGCFGSKDSTTITGPDGSKITVDENNGGGTITSGDTKTSVAGAASVTEAELGVPFYPGSVEKKDSAVKVDAPEAMTMHVARTTNDDVDKIKAFYESKISDLKFTIIDGPDGRSGMGTGTGPDGASISIVAQRKTGDATTEVSLSYTKKK